MTKTPSERISLIQRISNKLKDFDWPIIDLTLRQFGLPTSNDWPPDAKLSYIIKMIDDANDEILSQLHFHLYGEKSSTYPGGTLEYWQPGTYRIFLSHTSEYKKSALVLKEKIANFHTSVFVAHVDIQPTKEWQDEIELALESSDCLIALVTSDFHSSFWTDQEIGIAIGKGKLIIPIACGGEPYGFTSKYQWLKNDLDNIEQMRDEIFTILTKNNLSKGKFSEALVNKFESSYSFASARENIALLERVEYLDSDMLNRIQFAHDMNSQINESFGVTYRVQQLIKKMKNT